MISFPRFRSLGSSLRVANLPGVASHVWAGLVLAGGSATAAGAWAGLLPLIPAGLLLCMAGNLLNDWQDREWDARHRPERALPAGHFQPLSYLVGGGLLLLGGLGLAGLCGWPALAVALGIAVCILVYTRWHKRTAWLVLPLALCRALLPLMAAAAMPGPVAWSGPACLAAALFLMVAGLSLDARAESAGPARCRRAARALVWLAVLVVALPGAPVAHAAFVGLLPLCLWLVLAFSRYAHPLKARVSALLAGLPLLDLAILIPLVLASGEGTPPPAAWLVTLPALLAWATGRLLQRAAAAT
jgi:hypothetical protein